MKEELKKWLFDVENILINFPRKSIVFQNKIYDTSFSLLQHLLESNINKEHIKYLYRIFLC